MILVDVYVPVMNRTYDFFLDEDKPVKRLVAEINGQIAEKEDTKQQGEEEFWLCDMGKGIVLNGAFSLAEQGIGEGAGLLLV